MGNNFQWQTDTDFDPPPEVMGSAFPFSRPVTIGDALWFDTEMITAVSAKERSPQQAAQSVPTIDWFSNYALSQVKAGKHLEKD